MPKCRITVLKKMFDEDLAKEYKRHVAPCALFTEGQEFIAETFEPPEGFCGWAWNDICKSYMTLLFGGSFPGMKDKRTFIACCTDGVMPVVFKLERLED